MNKLKISRPTHATKLKVLPQAWGPDGAAYLRFFSQTPVYTARPRIRS